MALPLMCVALGAALSLETSARADAIAIAPPTAPAPVRPRPAQTAPAIITLEHDNTEITQSCIIRIPKNLVITDSDNNGVIHVAAPNLTIQFEVGSVLRGASPAAAATDYDTLSGVGIALDHAAGTRLVNLNLEGFRVGVRAVDSPNLDLDTARLVNLHRDRLASLPEAEDQRDWLWPHANDAGEWETRYGAAVLLRRCDSSRVHNVFIRSAQNGIILERCKSAEVFDNDCSFLSGWGVALWRTTDSTIARNALDFCIRGYSHTVYSRGQDSAGILLFEQCSRNTIALNSATHCGDGLFAFAGKEALGEIPAPAGFDHTRAGCNDNLIIGNDFSDAAAHGIEITFSFGNRILNNRLTSCNGCGVWAGYSQSTLIMRNTISHNGAPGAREGGGINIEHGRANTIAHNAFGSNTAAIRLWWDDDKALLETPWAKTNGHASIANRIVSNTFAGAAPIDAEFIDPAEMKVMSAPCIILSRTQETEVGGNTFTDITAHDQIQRDSESTVTTLDESSLPEFDELPDANPPGASEPFGKRASLAGRDKIIMTAGGPWDYASPMIRLHSRAPGRDEFEVYRLPDHVVIDILHPDPSAPPERFASATVRDREPEEMFQRLVVAPPIPKKSRAAKQGLPEPTPDPAAFIGGVYPYTLSIEGRAIHARETGTVVDQRWRVTFADLALTPEQRSAAAADQGRGAEKIITDALLDNACARADAVTLAAVPGFAFKFAHEGPSELALDQNLITAKLPADWFAARATSRMLLPGGRWRLVGRVDDALRVDVTLKPSGPNAAPAPQRVIDLWGRHAPTDVAGEFTTPGDGATLTEVEFTVRYFEMDGWAEVALRLEPAAQPPAPKTMPPASTPGPPPTAAKP